MPGLLFIPQVFAYTESYNDISVKTARKMIKKSKHSDLLILDVRTDAEYSVTHLYDADQLSYEDLENNLSEIDQYKDVLVIVYCKSGARSKNSSQILVDEGFSNVFNMEGGILAWIDAGYPVWSISHNVVVEDKGNIEITPRIIDSCSCGCPEGDVNDLQNSTEISVEINVLEENETYKEVLIEYEIDEISYETLMKRTLLFSSESHSDGVNQFYKLYYNEYNSPSYTLRYYLLEYRNKNNNNNLSITSILEISKSNFYESIETLIIYTPKDKSKFITLESIHIHKNITLSQYYKIIGKAAKVLSNIYRKSMDDYLKSLSDNYREISQEVKEFSGFIKKDLRTYDLDTQETSTVILDYIVPPPEYPIPSGDEEGCFGGDPYWDCQWCKAAVSAATLGACAALIWWNPVAGAWCLEAFYWMSILHGALAVCKSSYINCC